MTSSTLFLVINHTTNQFNHHKKRAATWAAQFYEADNAEMGHHRPNHITME